MMIQQQRLLLFVCLYILYFIALIGASMTEWSDWVYLVNNFLCFLFVTNVLWRYHRMSTKLWIMRLCLLACSSFGLAVASAYRLYAPDDKDAVTSFALVMILMAAVNLCIPLSPFDSRKEYDSLVHDSFTNEAEDEGILV